MLAFVTITSRDPRCRPDPSNFITPAAQASPLIGLALVALSSIVFTGALFLLATLGAPLGVSAIVAVAVALLTLTISIYSCKFAALTAAERAREAVAATPGVIMPFPGGIAASGSKAGSRYKFSIASTNHPFCPTLRESLGEACHLPAGVGSVMEIIINGADLATISQATQAAIAAAADSPGLVRISAGNYGGRLGKSFVYLRPGRV